MTEDEIATLVTAAGAILDVLRRADGRDKAAVYRQLGLKLTYQADPKHVIAEARPSAIMYETECPRGDLNPHALSGTSTSS
jgi:site-specific DNA recombinase